MRKYSAAEAKHQDTEASLAHLLLENVNAEEIAIRSEMSLTAATHRKKLPAFVGDDVVDSGPLQASVKELLRNARAEGFPFRAG